MHTNLVQSAEYKIFVQFMISVLLYQSVLSSCILEELELQAMHEPIETVK